MIPKGDLDQAAQCGCFEPWEIAEHLGRTEQFVIEAIKIYRTEGVSFMAEMSEELIAACM